MAILLKILQRAIFDMGQMLKLGSIVFLIRTQMGVLEMNINSTFCLISKFISSLTVLILTGMLTFSEAQAQTRICWNVHNVKDAGGLPVGDEEHGFHLEMWAASMTRVLAPTVGLPEGYFVMSGIKTTRDKRIFSAYGSAAAGTPSNVVPGASSDSGVWMTLTMSSRPAEAETKVMSYVIGNAILDLYTEFSSPKPENLSLSGNITLMKKIHTAIAGSPFEDEIYFADMTHDADCSGH